MKNSFRLTGRKHVHVALFACALAFLPWAARSATWNVGDYASLTNALTNAVNGDTIAISQNIMLSNAVPITGKGLTIEGNDYSISVPVPGFDESGIANATPSAFRVFSINASGLTNFIRNLTVKGGNAAGAINNLSGTLVLEGMTIVQSGGPGQGGGGVFNIATLYLLHCNVSRNGASYGGGFRNTGASATMFIEDCTISENRSLAASGGGGGGVNIQGNLYANNSTFAHNKSTELGGAFENYLGGTTSLFVNCTFAGNIAYNTNPLLKGGAIAQNGGVITVVNSLFAYNYWNNSGIYELNDLHNYQGTGTNISDYYCVFHSTTNQLLTSVSNTLYAGATNGSDDSIFAGGVNAVVLNAGGAPLGTNTIYQPYLVRLSATNLTPTALLQSNAGPSFAAGKGCRAAFSSSQAIPVVGYYSNATQWVDLRGTNSSNFEVLDDQNGANRTNSLILGAAVGTASNLFMLKVVATNGGAVSGASVYGDIYPAGTVVTVTAIPAVSNRFDRWDYVLGGSGTASSNNPYQVAVNTNITLQPVFTNFNGFTIAYSGNGYTGGTVPSQQVVTNGGSANIFGPGSMVKAGYDFSCWNTQSDGNGTDYAPGAGYSGPDNLMLYAKWALATMAVLGTNGAIIASGEPASAAKGTDFGSLLWGSALTNTFAITNSGNTNMTIIGVTTNGAGAAEFSIAGLPSTVPVGGVSNFTVRFAPANAGAYAAAALIANNSTTATYMVYLAGTGAKHDQAIANVMPTNGAVFATTSAVGLAATASSGLPVSFSVASGPGAISGGTNLTFTGSGVVNVAASQAGDTNWNAASTVTQMFAVARLNQTIAFPAIADQAVTNTVRLSATASSGLPVSFSVASGPGALAGGTNLTFTATGTVRVVASQSGDTNWNPAIPVTNTLSVTNGTVPAPEPATNLLAIVVTPSGGTWTLSGPAGYNGPISGEGSFGPTNVSTGTYTVLYGDLAGVQTPSNETAALTAGGSVEFHGAYIQDAPGGFGTNGVTYLALYERATGRWFARAPSGEVLLWAENWGGPDMIPVPGDFDGDGVGELAVYDPATGSWYIRTLSGTVLAWGENWGGEGLSPLIGDYTGDGLPDMMVESYGFGQWYCRTLAGDVVAWGENWGGLGLLAIPGDYNGDATWDMAVYGMGDGNWYIRTVNGELLAWALPFGGPGMLPVVGDYDGDGVFDLAVYGDGVWYIRTLAGDVLAWDLPFGGATLYPVPGDYDGDGRWDLALYSETLGVWYIYSLTQGVLSWNVPFGGPGLTPVYW
ncbi:MAG: choice-of-anchor D domain-containing protein [Lentisphaerae bacterium]|nr:choice-of-anchor D domain-containing protein [Lentisphaerota bacterium]